MSKLTVDYSKYADGLVPAVVQHWLDGRVLMVGFMNEAALETTRQTGHVTFFSRSKNRLWTKGETSGNFLVLKDILVDCDNDTLLVKADPIGPTCHTGADTCFGEESPELARSGGRQKEEGDHAGFLFHLERIIIDRKENPNASSYTTKLFASGINKVAQKVGEEAVELVIESKDDDRDLFLGEAADLMFHYLVLLQAKGHSLKDVVEVLKERHR
ncbi:MAG TPA: bifunctional phosphoribosyl-AMP cyclohydrolase/phosphoribosyl-ATP diphosphatase HisIE [Phnomibacter sp.]|nr:bifunctional phosphoribosyl-AMP cyclohydrolase/phosphoribosyl-ATP diphosphatase HisIE [Phnomibacter sp.]